MMLLRSIRLFRYRMPLCRPTAVRGHAVSWREGALVRVEGDAGRTGWGEVAPYPGLSRDTLTDALDALSRLADRPDPIPLDADGILTGRTGETLGPLPPSASFGLECALLDLLSGSSGVGLRGILSDHPQDRIAVNALLGGGASDEAGEEALRLAASGFRVFKLKVGEADPRTEGTWLRALSGELPPGCRFRADANRAWTVPQARAFLEGLADGPLDYLEEPLADPAGLAMLATSAPVALDETYRERGAAALAACPGCAAVVLKPSIAGGISRTLADAAIIGKHRARLVISSVFESGIGVRALAHVAAACGSPGVACGLDPYRWIAEDVVEPPVEMDTGMLDMADLERQLPMIRLDRMHPWSDHG